MPKCLDFGWGGERGRQRGQFESAHMKFPSAFCYSTVTKSWISSRDGGKDESHRPWTALQGRSTTGATTQLPLSSALPPQAVRAQVTAETASPAAAAEPRAELPRTAAPRAGTGASAADTQRWAAERPAAGWSRGLGERDSDTGLSPRGAGPGPAPTPAPPGSSPRKPAPRPSRASTKPPGAPAPRQPPLHACGPQGPPPLPPGHDPAPPNRRPRPLRHLLSARRARPRPAASHWPRPRGPPSRPPIRAPGLLRPAHRRRSSPARGSR